MYPIKFKNLGMPVMSKLMEDMFDGDISKFVGADYHHSIPKVNIIENDNGFRIDVAAPGFEKENFKVLMEGDTLVIKAEAKAQNEEEKVKFTRKEFSYSGFERKFILPEFINKEVVNAKYNNGILSIELSKATEAKFVKEIQIQ